MGALSGKELQVELVDLYTTDYQLLKPIPINIKYEEHLFIATQESLNLWAEERTLMGAEKYLAHEIVRLYNKLSNLGKNKLGPYPAESLDYLKQFIS